MAVCDVASRSKTIAIPPLTHRQKTAAPPHIRFGEPLIEAIRLGARDR
jgi:hypothetical protein